MKSLELATICAITVFYETLKKKSVIADPFLAIVSAVVVIFTRITLTKIFFLIDEVLTLNMTLVFPKNVLNSYYNTGYCICYDVTHKSINFISFKDIADILFTV